MQVSGGIVVDAPLTNVAVTLLGPKPVGVVVLPFELPPAPPQAVKNKSIPVKTNPPVPIPHGSKRSATSKVLNL